MAAMVGAVSAAPAVIEQRAMSSATVVEAIENIKFRSSNLTIVVQGINVGPTVILTPLVIKPITDGFQDIINLAKQDIQNMKDNPMMNLGQDPKGQNAICTAFREFVGVHQVLLRVVIGKSGVLQSLGGGPIAAVLRVLEGVVDTIAFSLIDAVPTCSAGLSDDRKSLKVTIQQAECAYTPAGPLGLSATCTLFQAVGSL